MWTQDVNYEIRCSPDCYGVTICAVALPGKPMGQSRGVAGCSARPFKRFGFLSARDPVNILPVKKDGRRFGELGAFG